MYSFSVMPLLLDKADEICEDIKQQKENRIADCALFMFPLVPEGNPVIDKAKMMCEKYLVFKEKLDKLGLKSGILIQCSIGHGYPLNELFPFEQYVGLEDGEKKTVCCPYDENFREFFKGQIKTLAKCNPDIIMLDDDFRLMHRDGRGCACPRHMREFNRMAGTSLTQAELWKEIKNGKYRDIFVETQRQSLVGAIKKFREGIDEVNPKLQGAVCTAGVDAEFFGEEARIFSGAGNPVIARFNNGRYHPNSNHGFSELMFRTAHSANLLKNDVDILIDEADTIPYNRYSTNASHLHAHLTAAILEGAKGVKHWITTLDEYEPKCGKAYRDKLTKHSGFYSELEKMYPTLKPIGLRVPLSNSRHYYFDTVTPYDLDEMYNEAWIGCVMERLGLPFYYSSEKGGTVLMSGCSDKRFTDDEIKELFTQPMFISSDECKRLNERGFSEFTGVDVKAWDGENLSGELIQFSDGEKKVDLQVNSMQLIPAAEAVRVKSWTYHLENGVNRHKLFPAVTMYKNKLGGITSVFSGTPKASFHYTEAFSFLSYYRKNQLVEIIKECGELPIYYDDDAEVTLRAWKCDDGTIMAAVFNIGIDTLEELTFVTEKEINSVEYLSGDGTRKKCEFKIDKNKVRVIRRVESLSPEVLFFK